MIINAFLAKIVGGWYEVKEELMINIVTGEYALYILACAVTVSSAPLGCGFSIGD